MVNHLTRLDECYERGLLRKVAASNDKAMQSLAQAREWITRQGMTVMQVRSGLHSWQPTWDISMQHGQFCSVTGYGRRATIVSACISNPIVKKDYWKTNGSYNSIACGDCGRAINTVLTPARLSWKSGRL